MTKLYLVRHGETVDNVRQILQGQMQGQLNDTGIRQAEAVRDEMADVSLDAVVASDLQRSIDTAAIIAQPHGLQVVTTPLLRERDWGDFTGTFIPDLKGKVWPDNVESLDAMCDRARRFMRFVVETYPDKQVLAVGHGIINKAIQAVYYHLKMHEVQKMNNGEVRVLEFE
jgi:probable phosphoglycerate mutase